MRTLASGTEVTRISITHCVRETIRPACDISLNGYSLLMLILRSRSQACAGSADIDYLEHLPILHLNRQENCIKLADVPDSVGTCVLTHHESGQPDTTSAKPENPRTLRLEQLCTRIRCDDSSNTSQTRQHAAHTTAVGSIE
jgi:hypothetical protein